MDEKTVSIFVAGDICPVGRVHEPFARGAAEEVFGDVIPLIQAADVAVGNLECPLGEGLSPIRKSGPNLSAPVSGATTLAKAGFAAMGLANNHILDFGSEGLESTRKACEDAGVAPFGAGPSLDVARRLHIAQVRGLRIAFLAVAEDERCLAGPAIAGANPLEAMSVVRTLKEHEGRFDRLVVLLHGGNEHFPFPSPWLRDCCRFLVELGADVVACQHSHCVGSIETYRGATILYGQGNFLFNYAEHGEGGSQGLGLTVSFRAGEPAEVQLHPIEQNPKGAGIRQMPAEAAAALLQGLRERSEVLADPARYASTWERYCETRRPAYLSKLFTFGKWARRLNRGEWMFKLLSDKSLLGIYNMLSCESHRAAFRTGLDLSIDRRPASPGASR